MKIHAVIIVIILISSKLSYSNSSLQAAEMGACRDLEMSLMLQFIDEDKELPTSWDEFQEIRLIKKNSSDRYLFKINLINSFSLVPGIPIIKDQLGVSHEYSGLRLFLISRQRVNTKSSGFGRCAILLKQDESRSKFIRAYSFFIPEETAKIILSQINEFDPTKQPLAFDEKFFVENKNLIQKDPTNKLPAKAPLLSESSHAGSETGQLGIFDTPRSLWIILVSILLFLLLVCLLIYNRRRNY